MLLVRQTPYTMKGVLRETFYVVHIVTENTACLLNNAYYAQPLLTDFFTYCHSESVYKYLSLALKGDKRKGVLNLYAGKNAHYTSLKCY